MIEVRHLSHSFGPHWALKDCSFHLKKGEFLFLSGPSGAGKTTLLRLLFAGLPIHRGEAAVAGYSLNDIRNSQVPLLRRQVSVVFQDFKILPERSVYENVILPLQVRGLSKTHSDRRVRAVVRALGLEKRINLMCGELSGGEQQRVAVARAFVVNPQVLLADEPTGNLDPDLSFRLMDLFKQFQAYGTTMIVATHSQDLMKRHPEARMIRLEEGMITAANWPGASLCPGLEEEGRKGAAGRVSPTAAPVCSAAGQFGDTAFGTQPAISGQADPLPGSAARRGEFAPRPQGWPGAERKISEHNHAPGRTPAPSSAQAPETQASGHAPRHPAGQRGGQAAEQTAGQGAGTHGESRQPVTTSSDRELLRGATGTQASGQRTMYQGALKGPLK